MRERKNIDVDDYSCIEEIVIYTAESLLIIMMVLFMKDIEFHTLINSVTEVVYVVSMHCGLPGLNYQDSQKKIFTHEGLSAHAHNNYC